MKKGIRIALIVLGVLLLLLLVGPFLIPISPAGTLSPHELAYPDSQFINVTFDGVRDLSVHYQVKGEGEPVFVLLHGFAASTFSWREVIGPLSEHGRVIAFDWIPYGLTERPLPGSWTGDRSPYSREAQVDLTLAVMDALGVERAILVGNSAGGAIAMQTYLEHPDRIEALILVDPAVFLPTEDGRSQPHSTNGFGLLTSPIVRFIANTPQMNRVGPLLVRNIKDWGLDFARSAWHNPDLITDDIWAGYLKPLQVENWDIGLWEALKASGSDTSYLADHLDGFTLPVLVVTGDDDRIVPTDNSVRLAGMLPDALLAIIPDCGHVPHEECPDVFMEVVNGFLAQLP